MINNLEKILRNYKQLIFIVKYFKKRRDKAFKFINLVIFKYLSPSSKYFGSPKHELWTWNAVEEYVKQKQRNGDKEIFIKQLYKRQITLLPPVLTIGSPEPEAALEPKENCNYCEYVCMFPNARISMRDFNLITEDDYFIQPLSNYYSQQPHSHVLYTKIKLPVTKKLLGKTLFLKGWNNVYHTLHDAVCAIKLVEDAGIDINSIDNFLIYDYSENWYHNVYSKLGLPKHKFINGAGKNSYECEQLFITTYFEHHGIWYSDFLKKIFLPQKALQNNYGKKLFISRAKALTRRIINEEEVVSFLRKKGFSIVFCEDLSIEEQASLYHEAECIISVHGANLTNILFCRPGTKICEIRYSKHVMYYKKLYYEIAVNCKLQYYLIYTSKAKPSTNGDISDSDIYVNIKDVDNMLSAMKC